MAVKKKKTTARKTAAKKTTARKTVAKKTTARKTAAKKTTARKTTAKKTTARKTTAKKTTARKTTAKKTTAKKTAAKKTTARKTVAKKISTTAIRDAFTKTQMQNAISEATDLTKKQVNGVLEELANIINRHIKTKGAGEFTLPGLLKIKVVRKPATKARKGINPFTGEETIFKAKPARNVVKVKPLKKLKDMAA